MKVGRFVVRRERPGVIGETAVWVVLDTDGYLYIAGTLRRLLWELVTGWQHDRNLVG